MGGPRDITCGFRALALPGALAPAAIPRLCTAVVVAAALGGGGRGLAATFGALILVNFVFGHFDLADSGSLTRQLIWVTASVGVSLLAGMQRQARLRQRRQARELRRWNDELEARVEQRTAEIAEANSQLRDANQKLAQLDQAKTAFVDDITARKEAAIEVTESRSRLSGIVEFCNGCDHQHRSPPERGSFQQRRREHVSTQGRRCHRAPA